MGEYAWMVTGPPPFACSAYATRTASANSQEVALDPAAERATGPEACWTTGHSLASAGKTVWSRVALGVGMGAVTMGGAVVAFFDAEGSDEGTALGESVAVVGWAGGAADGCSFLDRRKSPAVSTSARTVRAVVTPMRIFEPRECEGRVERVDSDVVIGCAPVDGEVAELGVAKKVTGVESWCWRAVGCSSR